MVFTGIPFARSVHIVQSTPEVHRASMRFIWLAGWLLDCSVASCEDGKPGTKVQDARQQVARQANVPHMSFKFEPRALASPTPGGGSAIAHAYGGARKVDPELPMATKIQKQILWIDMSKGLGLARVCLGIAYHKWEVQAR